MQINYAPRKLNLRNEIGVRNLTEKYFSLQYIILKLKVLLNFDICQIKVSIGKTIKEDNVHFDLIIWLRIVMHSSLCYNKIKQKCRLKEKKSFSK